MFAGYWRMPEKTREEFTADGCFRTGDVGEILDERLSCGSSARAKDLIITGGLNVYPKEIEERIDALPGVVEIGGDRRARRRFRRGRHRGRRRATRHTLDAKRDVIAALKARSRASRFPKRVHFVDELPRNAMGKVRRTCCASGSAAEITGRSEAATGRRRAPSSTG